MRVNAISTSPLYHALVSQEFALLVAINRWVSCEIVWAASEAH
jgi:hypothetical protein